MALDMSGEFLTTLLAQATPNTAPIDTYSNPTETWTSTIAFWVGCGCLAAAACVFGLGFRSAKRENWEEFYLNNFIITSWASLAYMAMAIHQGELDLPGHQITGGDSSRHVYWARYADWVVTTPLILYDLMKLSGVRPTVKKAVIYADIAMIITGFIAAVSPYGQRMIWYIVSCMFEVAIFVLLLGPVMKSARRQDPTVTKLFTQALGIFSVFFWLYPVVWILGSKGFGIYGTDIETILILCLDLTAKVFYGFYLVRDREVLQRVGELSQVEA
jgi:bacteriorhodopsin